jgi:hypothetical protein
VPLRTAVFCSPDLAGYRLCIRRGKVSSTTVRSRWRRPLRGGSGHPDSIKFVSTEHHAARAQA